MNSSLYKIFINSALALLIGAMPVYSLELDMSIDEEIRKNYNPSKLELDALPPLPEMQNSTEVLPDIPSSATPSVPSVPKSSTAPPKSVPTTT